ncbi:MAG TPA: hypothetical protein DDZ91_02555 [Firmicutes bacterium]|jgi:hypothetical protein|nr:hypothetical protein [Bacillota bacterium]
MSPVRKGVGKITARTAYAQEKISPEKQRKYPHLFWTYVIYPMGAPGGGRVNTQTVINLSGGRGD